MCPVGSDAHDVLQEELIVRSIVRQFLAIVLHADTAVFAVSPIAHYRERIRVMSRRVEVAADQAQRRVRRMQT